MLKFLWRKNKQQSAEHATDDEESTADQQQQPVNDLEEVLKPLFETIKPTAPEEYVGR